MFKTEIRDEIDPLTRLAIEHGTDKWGVHFYTPLYHQLFSRLRDEPIRVLEIGAGGYHLKTVGGASLAMWADYFPKGQITGIDIVEKRLALCDRVKLFQGSQDDPAFLKKVSDERGPFDIIIDDGSHIPKQVVTSFHILFPYLVNGGMYVIEDVQTTFWPQFGGLGRHGGDTLKLARTVIECLNHAEIEIVGRSHSLPPFAKEITAFRAYHNVFVIDKGDNHEPSAGAYKLDNPFAVNAVHTIEEQLERAPTPEGMANLIGVYLYGGNLERADETAAHALMQWPENPAVLFAAYNAAMIRNDPRAKVDYLERIIRIEPDNSELTREMEQARRELDQLNGRPNIL